MTNTYITAKDYMRAVTGQEVNSLVGNLLRLSSAVVAGGTALSTPATTVNLSQYDNLYIFDGASSEVVTVTATTNSGATSIPVTALAFNHASGVVICSDGASGSLGDSIVRACGELEDICYQSLFQQTVTENLPLQTMRASLGSDMQLYLQPTYFPVTSVASCSVVYLSGAVTTLDVSRAIIEFGGRLVKLPLVQSITTGQATVYLPPISRYTAGEVNIQYTSGYTLAAMPPAIGRAAVLLTSVILSDRLNATGAADYQSGKVKTTVFLRGDLSGESALYKRAVKLLQIYTRKAW